MRGFRLARVAAQAELLRLRHRLRRQVVRAIVGATAVVFVFLALIGLHVAGVLALAEHVPPVEAVLIVVAIDVVIAIVLAVVAMRDVPGEVEREALAVRRTAMQQVVETVAIAALLRGLLRVRSLREVAAVIAAAVAAWVAGAAR